MVFSEPLLLVACTLTGYSLFCGLALAITQLGFGQLQHKPWLRGACGVCLAAVMVLQGVHMAWFVLGWAGYQTVIYRMALFLVAPAFMLFALPLLTSTEPKASGRQLALHGLPLLLGVFLPWHTALPVAFAIGAGYLVWLAKALYALRQAAGDYRAELLGLWGVFAVALMACVLGLLQWQWGGLWFFYVYASAIGLAFWALQILLSIKPQLATTVMETAAATYAQSTLTKLDCEQLLQQLTHLMAQQRVYEQADLSLPQLAQQLGVTGHQLSELLNSRLGKGFSRYVREQRVAAAKQMLTQEPSVSVLAIGMSVGFTSQSNFYEAFREIEGMPPGQYRKWQHRQA